MENAPTVVITRARLALTIISPRVSSGLLVSPRLKGSSLLLLSSSCVDFPLSGSLARVAATTFLHAPKIVMRVIKPVRAHHRRKIAPSYFITLNDWCSNISCSNFSCSNFSCSTFSCSNFSPSVELVQDNIFLRNCSTFSPSFTYLLLLCYC